MHSRDERATTAASFEIPSSAINSFMDIAIVTGASSALGEAVSRRLIELGFRVYGLGGDYSRCSLQNVSFKPLACDLADPEAVEKTARSILEKERGVYVLVNNAKFFGGHSFTEMENRELEQVLRINLLCPLVLLRTLAPSLRELQGYVIQLGASLAQTSSGGPAGAAASGGLKWMGERLFEELRDEGVKVCHLSPEPNRGHGGRGRVLPGARAEASIDPEAVAQAVEQLLQSRFGNTITELVLRPLRTRESEQEPVRRLPNPEPQPVPYTVPREMIEAEEQLEEEDLVEAEKRRRKGKKPSKTDKTDKTDKPSEADNAAETDQSGKAEKADQTERPDESARADKSDEADSSERRRRRRRKPKPPMEPVGFLDPESERAKATTSPRAKVSEAVAAPTSTASSEETVVKKVPSKKTGARKALKKTTTRKVPVKKTAKKAVAKKTAAKKAVAKKTVKKAATKKTTSRKSPRKMSGTKSAL